MKLPEAVDHLVSKELSVEDATVFKILWRHCHGFTTTQGELLPLEIGIHALAVVEKSSGGRGKTGGLSGYAEKIGKGRPSLTEYVNAAKVYSSKDVTRVTGLLDKHRHLSEISKADDTLWPLLVDQLVSAGWSVKDTQHWVGRVRDNSLLDIISVQI